MTPERTVEEHYSLCLVSAVAGHSSKCRYYRIADFDPSADEKKLTQPVFRSSTAKRGQGCPSALENSAADAHFDTRTSDFCYLKWLIYPRNNKLCLSQSLYEDEVLLNFDEPREVFFLVKHSGEEGLRKALLEGIPFKGRTTSSFFIVYETEPGVAYAVLCNKKDYLFVDGLIRLPSESADSRRLVPSAAKVRLNLCDIISAAHQTSNRKVYARFDEPEIVGKVLLRSFECYAADYVRWFLDSRQIRRLSRTGKQRLDRIVDIALSRPSAIEKYLGEEAPREQITALREAIIAASSETDCVRKRVLDALLEDSALKQECYERYAQESGRRHAEIIGSIGRAEEEYGNLMASLKDARESLATSQNEKSAVDSEIAGLKESLVDMRSERSEVEASLVANLSQKAEIEGAISNLREELNGLQVSKVVASNEIRSILSLKDGLDVSLEPAGGGQSGIVKLAESPGSDIECTMVDKPFRAVLSSNLRVFGAISVSGDSERERIQASIGIESALAVTRMLAIAQPIAGAMADALCIALGGTTATRIWAPADYRDAAALLDRVNKSPTKVVLIENVIDSVNEGMLNILLYGEIKPIVILSFMSHPSARLVSKEAWESLFLPSVESLSICRLAAKKSRKLLRLAKTESEARPQIDEVLDSAQALKSELKGLTITDGVALISAAVRQAAEEIVDDGAEVDSYVSQHIAVSTISDRSDLEKLEGWSGEDCGLKCLAEKLDLDER